MRRRCCALLVALAGSLACQGPAATWIDAPLGGSPRFAPILPDALDAAAAELAVATLSGDTQLTVAALDGLERAERLKRVDLEASRLVPIGHDAANAVLHPGRSWREATQELLGRRDLDASTRVRLERTLRDDPLELAGKRLREARFTSVARVFNAVSTPVGRSLLNPLQLPYTLGYSLARVAVDTAGGDALDLRRRQTLVHWHDFTRRYPDAPEAAELAPRIAAYQAKWNLTRARKALTKARDAQDAGRIPAALLYAQRSLREVETDAAGELVGELGEELDWERQQRDRSLGFRDFGEPPTTPLERELILSALNGERFTEPGHEESDDASAFADELRFLRAQTGDDTEWQALEEIAEQNATPLARHAAADLGDPLRNPERAYRRARSAERRRTALWVTLGPLSATPERGAVGMANYLLELPLRIQSLILLPIRTLELFWRQPPAGHARAAGHARRYLSLNPQGESADELRHWLVSYEKRRKNWLAVLRLEQDAPDADPSELAKLRERAAQQGLEVARSEERSDLRAALLSDVARRFPETGSGREARRAAREQAFEGTPHEIRFTRGFLSENPAIRGPQGLDLSPALLDDNPRNGELHPDGVALVGGRDAVVALLAQSGDDEDPPEKLWVRLPAERLARVVARVEESRFRASLLDDDDTLEADPQRDAVFERARLGLADRVDTRSGAEAAYTYRGMRERYGMVRGRDSILPVALVVQGSLTDLSLGAFPRLIPPRKTPDAVLYRD